MNEFVLRPGRTSVIWAGKAQRISVKAQSEVAISISCDDKSRTLKLSQAAFEHDFSVDLAEKQQVKLVARNVSGTRKARLSFEVKAYG